MTEETSGIDLVVEQLRVADGLPLSITDTPVPRGHAFEFRINAEDVGRGFLPTPGPVRVFEPPSGPGVRVDTGVLSGSTVPGTFDSLMAKLIVTGATRAQAIARARRALQGVPHRGRGLGAALPSRGDGARRLHVGRCVQGAHALDRDRLRQHPGGGRAQRAAARPTRPWCARRSRSTGGGWRWACRRRIAARLAGGWRAGR